MKLSLVTVVLKLALLIRVDAWVLKLALLIRLLVLLCFPCLNPLSTMVYTLPSPVVALKGILQSSVDGAFRKGGVNSPQCSR